MPVASPCLQTTKPSSQGVGLCDNTLRRGLHRSRAMWQDRKLTCTQLLLCASQVTLLGRQQNPHWGKLFKVTLL